MLLLNSEPCRKNAIVPPTPMNPTLSSFGWKLIDPFRTRKFALQKAARAKSALTVYNYLILVNDYWKQTHPENCLRIIHDIQYLQLLYKLQDPKFSSTSSVEDLVAFEKSCENVNKPEPSNDNLLNENDFSYFQEISNELDKIKTILEGDPPDYKRAIRRIKRIKKGKRKSLRKSHSKRKSKRRHKVKKD